MLDIGYCIVGFEMVPERKTRDNQRIGFSWKLVFTCNFKVTPLCSRSSYGNGEGCMKLCITIWNSRGEVH